MGGWGWGRGSTPPPRTPTSEERLMPDTASPRAQVAALRAAAQAEAMALAADARTLDATAGTPPPGAPAGPCARSSPTSLRAWIVLANRCRAASPAGRSSLPWPSAMRAAPRSRPCPTPSWPTAWSATPRPSTSGWRRLPTTISPGQHPHGRRRHARLAGCLPAPSTEPALHRWDVAIMRDPAATIDPHAAALLSDYVLAGAFG